MVTKKVLVVDDEPGILRLVSRGLERQGYQVLQAQDGQDALEKARQEAPDLIILDLILPKMNGYEVCTLLKQDIRYRDIPIVMFTANAHDEAERLGRECGADQYMHKPYALEELAKLVSSLIGGNGSDAEAR